MVFVHTVRYKYRDFVEEWTKLKTSVEDIEHLISSVHKRVYRVGTKTFLAR